MGYGKHCKKKRCWLKKNKNKNKTKKLTVLLDYPASQFTVLTHCLFRPLVYAHFLNAAPRNQRAIKIAQCIFIS